MTARPPLKIAGARSGALLGYLKALGLLRIVAEQAESRARGCWEHGIFVLHSSLDHDALCELLLERWIPAPVVSPWNGGSGFHPKDNVKAFVAIEADDSPRLAPFHDAIIEARQTLQRLGLSDKPDPKTEKPALLRELRAVLPDDALAWLDAAAILLDDGTAFPPLLGSGGNDGRYDIANNYAQAVVAVLGDGARGVTPADWLTAALTGASIPLSPKLSLAHLHRDASPVNSPRGESDALGNPWDLVFAVTGTLILGSGAARRLADGGEPSLVAPFTFAATGAGYGSAVAKEKGKSEVWMPVWGRPASLREVESMFREARARVARRSSRSGLDAARAAGELGVARGISAFERFAILERSGRTNVAVHAGTISVAPRDGARALATLEPWLGRMLGHASSKHVPQSHRDAIGRLERAVFALAEDDSESRAVAVLAALGRVEAVMSWAGEEDRPANVRPPSPLANNWIELLGVRRAEYRVAMGFASLRDRTRQSGVPALRQYLHGTGISSATKRLAYGVAAGGRPPAAAPLLTRLAAVSERRVRDAAAASRPLAFDIGLPVSLADLTLLAAGKLDERLLGDLVDGLVTMDFSGVSRAPHPTLDHQGSYVDPIVQTLMLAAYDPGREPGRSEDPSVARPNWPAWLRAERVAPTLRDASLRLRLAGLPQIAYEEDFQPLPESGPRLAACLLARPSQSDLRAAIRHLTDVPAHLVKEPDA